MMISLCSLFKSVNQTTADLVRRKFHPGVDVHQLEGHGEVLVAVCGERALGFGGIVHPGRKGTPR